MNSVFKNKYDLMMERLTPTFGKDRLKRNEPMKNHTSFKIGGPAALLISVASVEEIVEVKTVASELELGLFVMGNGSNLLVSDKGIDKVVLKISESMTAVRIDGDKVYADAGILLSALSSAIVKEELAGFEFASGIPGTLGGAICMNAGAYGGEMKDIVTAVHLMDVSGNCFWLTRDEMAFGYRTSIVESHRHIVLGAQIQLSKGELSQIKATLADLTEKRTSKQPLHLPSAGSTFKRPEGYFAGKLIEDANLKGLRHGGAQVSEKHSGFVVNIGGATCADVTHLIGTIQKVVLDKFGVLLEPEVRITGEE